MKQLLKCKGKYTIDKILCACKNSVGEEICKEANEELYTKIVDGEIQPSEDSNFNE